MPAQSVSTSAGSSGAIALTSGGQQAGGGRALDPGPHAAVVGEQVDPVAGPGGERRQQQRGVHRGVQARRVADPAGRRCGRCRARSSTRRSRSGRQVRTMTSAAPRGGPPVDRADVVADDVLAQRVELGALAADLHRGPAVELAQPGQLRGRCWREVNGGSTRSRPRARRASPAGAARPSGPTRAHGDPGRRPVAAPGRAQQRWSSRRRSPGRHVEPVPRAATAPARRQPGVAQPAADPAPRPGWSRSARTVAGSPSRTAASPARASRSDRTRAGQREVDRQHAAASSAGRRAARRARTASSSHHDGTPRPARPAPARPVSAIDRASARGRGRWPSTPSSTASAVTPSSSASGRSSTRCRSVGRASALTSSGVT